MLKRIIPVLVCVSIVCCFFALPASAASNKRILNYQDYILTSNVDYLGQRWDRFQLPRDLCCVVTSDKYGIKIWDSGVFYGNIEVIPDIGQTAAVIAYWPGTFNNGVYLDASNFQNGTRVSVDFQFTLSDIGYQTDITGYSFICVQYYDSNFNLLGFQKSEPTYYEFADSQYNGRMTSTLNLVPSLDTAYLGFYSTFDMQIERSNDFNPIFVEWQIGSPMFDSYNVSSGPSFDHPTGTPQDYFDDNILWLRDVVDEFLDFEIAPGFSLNKVMYVILVIGTLFWFLKVIS